MKENQIEKSYQKSLKERGVKIFCEDNADYFEVEPSTYGENVGFDFDMNGNFKKLI